MKTITTSQAVNRELSACTTFATREQYKQMLKRHTPLVNSRVKQSAGKDNTNKMVFGIIAVFTVVAVLLSQFGLTI